VLVPGDDSPATEAAKTVASDAGRSIKTGDRVTTAGGIRGIILSIKDDDSIIIRVAPDNLKLEVAKSAIASVTTQEDVFGVVASASGSSSPGANFFAI
jgi:preprotein translocase YajC subunit